MTPKIKIDKLYLYYLLSSYDYDIYFCIYIFLIFKWVRTSCRIITYIFELVSLSLWLKLSAKPTKSLVQGRTCVYEVKQLKHYCFCMTPNDSSRGLVFNCFIQWFINVYNWCITLYLPIVLFSKPTCVLQECNIVSWQIKEWTKFIL